MKKVIFVLLAVVFSLTSCVEEREEKEVRVEPVERVEQVESEEDSNLKVDIKDDNVDVEGEVDID